MDPLTQGLLGAALPQSVADRRSLGLATVLGFLSGMAPDLDVLIRSSSDPLLFLEYHRQSTHSLFFIPIGGTLCAGLFWLLWGRRRGKMPFKTAWWYCTLGYGTHALLDACTTYGTQLWWPLSNARVAWNTVSVIDPIYTLPLLLLVVSTLRLRQPRLAWLALVWALAYPGLGWVQRERAAAMGWELAASRGHEPLQLEAKPSFANLLVWKIVYETDQRYYVDAVRAGRRLRVYPGESVEKLDIERDFPWLDHQSQQARDVERFRWFSNGYIAQDPANPARLIDIRYSMLPNEIDALWGIELSTAAKHHEHAAYVVQREGSRERGRALLKMIFD